MVRFLDNFSAGTRGAASAEYFLAAGYAVLFLSRQHSQFPFTRCYSHTTNPFFDVLEETTNGDKGICVKADEVNRLLPILHAYQEAKNSERLLTVPFVTVVEYLFLLRNISLALVPLKAHALIYLAAAVSDFFLPLDKLSEHKIQSRDGALSLELEQVPKVLHTLVHDWAPNAYVVTFKLETDETLILPKAERSLQNNGHQIVIGNLLQKRKHEVVFVERADSGAKHTLLRVTDDGREIEQDIVARLAQLQDAWIAHHAATE